MIRNILNPRKTQFCVIKFGLQPFSKGWQGVGQRPAILIPAASKPLSNTPTRALSKK